VCVTMYDDVTLVGQVRDGYVCMMM
jgi:hypothetical protein